jgi:hypothetical protein
MKIDIQFRIFLILFNMIRILNKLKFKLIQFQGNISFNANILIN